MPEKITEVKERGYYYNAMQKRLAEVDAGNILPEHEGTWEFIGKANEMSATEALAKVRDLYPDLDVGRDVDFVPHWPKGGTIPGSQSAEIEG
jgi:hypothetical protein